MTGMENYTLSDLGVFVGIVGSTLVLIIGAVQKSRCREIKLCPPMCIRDVPPPIPIPPEPPLVPENPLAP